MDQRARYLALLDELRALADQKGHDYAGDGPFINTWPEEALGVPRWTGTLLRMLQKQQRLVNVLRQGNAVAGETARDTLRDQAVYALFTIVLGDEEGLFADGLKEEA
jgi:hypothetical protein